MADTLLAHLIPRFAVQSEPLATQALAYVLNTAPDVSKAFVSVVHQTGFEPFDVGRIAAEERHGDGIPDLTIRDTAGVIRVLVENKFWSGLTDTQPVGYLDQLPGDEPAALLFVVPHARLHIVWAELKERCATRKIDLTDEAKTDDIAWSRTGNRILAITSWKHVLAQLQQAASAGGHNAIEQDIIQLRGLTDQENTAEFLPLREDEVTSATLARRLINYTDLIDAVVDRLIAARVADTKKSGRYVCDYTWVGRGVRLHSRFGAWFGVDFKAWGNYGITPLWWELNTTEPFSGITAATSKVQSLIEEAQDSDDDFVYIPIRLKTGVERDRVIDAIVEQIRSIGDRLNRAFPLTGRAGGAGL